MLLNDFLKEGIKALEPLYPVPEARSLLNMLCEGLYGIQKYTHIVEPEFALTDAQAAALQAALGRLAAGEPIQYVLGRAEFCGLTFQVTPAVLIPRPETEMLVSEAIKIGRRTQQMRLAYGRSAEPVRVLDLCTGSGCIAWTLALSIPGCRVVGVDNSPEALRVAAAQPFGELLKERGAEAPVFVEADVLASEADFAYGPFDLILSNPPYIRPSEKARMRVNVLAYEPHEALFVPEDDALLFYRAVARWSQRLFSDTGKGLTEINEELGPQTEAVFRAADFAETEIVRDYSDKDRFVFYRK